MEHDSQKTGKLVFLRSLSGLISGGGALLALCAFLPFVRSCQGHVLVPAEEVGLYPPHLFGLMTCVTFLGFSLGRRIVALQRIYGWLAVATVVYLAVRANILFLKQFEPLSLLFSAISLLCVGTVLLSFKRRLSMTARLGRQTWSTGMSIGLWFVLFVALCFGEPLLGFWMGVGSCAAMTVGAIALEVMARRIKG